ncbi:PKD domain-containing protein, partial [Helicobacter trogontum]
DYNTEFDTNIIEVYVTKNIIAVNEIVGFHIVTSIELVEVEWDFGDGEVSTQKDNILKSFSKEGSYNVRLKALVEVENKDYANDKDQDKFVMKEYFRDLEILVC